MGRYTELRDMGQHPALRRFEVALADGQRITCRDLPGATRPSIPALFPPLEHLREALLPARVELVPACRLRELPHR